MRRQEISYWKDIVYLSLSLGLLYYGLLGTHPFFVPDEARYSEIVREMLRSGDYITPQLHGIPFLDKPILYYWLNACAMRVFGIHEWVMRLWPATLGLLGCLVTYGTTRFIWNRRTGLFASIILALNPLYYGAAHYANLDLEVAVWISISLLCALSGLHAKYPKQRTGFFFFAYFTSGLAVLTKGLIGIIFPVLIIGLWALWQGRWWIIQEMRCGLGIITLTLITLPWYMAIEHAIPGFWHFFFVVQQFSRFLSHDVFNSQSPVWFYGMVLLIGTFPLGLLAFPALLRATRTLITPIQSPNTLFLILWFWIIFIFFSCPASKLIGYILPTLPPLAILMARDLDVNQYGIRQSRQLFYSLAALSICIIFLVFQSAGNINNKSIKSLAEALQTKMQPQDQVIEFYQQHYDLPLYLDHPVAIVENWQNPAIAKQDNWVRELWYGIPFAKDTSLLMTESQFWKQWHANQRIWVVIEDGQYDNFKIKSQGRYQEIMRYKHLVILTNHLKLE